MTYSYIWFVLSKFCAIRSRNKLELFPLLHHIFFNNYDDGQGYVPIDTTNISENTIKAKKVDIGLQ